MPPVLHLIMFNATVSIHPTFSLPYCAHKSVLYICISIPSLQIDHRYHFSRFHVYVLMYNIINIFNDPIKLGLQKLSASERLTAHKIKVQSRSTNGHLYHFSSVSQSCPTLCDPMNCSTPGLPIHHQLSESTQTHVH